MVYFLGKFSQILFFQQTFLDLIGTSLDHSCKSRKIREHCNSRAFNKFLIGTLVEHEIDNRQTGQPSKGIGFNGVDVIIGKKYARQGCEVAECGFLDSVYFVAVELEKTKHGCAFEGMIVNYRQEIELDGQLLQLGGFCESSRLDVEKTVVRVGQLRYVRENIEDLRDG